MSMIRFLIVALAVGSLGVMGASCPTMPVTTQGDDAASGDSGGGGVGTLYYSRTDGAVAAINVETGDEVAVLSSALFTGANPGAGRGIAFDPVTRLMWYSATDGQLHSVNVDTEAAILYAKAQMVAVFGLVETSLAIDAGTDLGLGLLDLLGNPPFDDPLTNDPWPDDGQPGIYDLGAIEHIPAP